jgi:hypothetical protein
MIIKSTNKLRAKTCSGIDQESKHSSSPQLTASRAFYQTLFVRGPRIHHKNKQAPTAA